MDFNQFGWLPFLAIIIFVDAPIFFQWEPIELAPSHIYWTQIVFHSCCCVLFFLFFSF